MLFNVTIDRDEDSVWVMECPAIPGCVNQGATKDEALENIREWETERETEVQVLLLEFDVYSMPLR